MTDKLQVAISRGRAAKLILEDETWNEVLSELGEVSMEQSYKGATIDVREEHRNDLRSLDRIRERLEAMVADGREADREVARLNPT